jgi:hypothetical protein
VLISEGSCGFENHVNEEDDKLKTCTIQKEDQKNILMIGGIQVFLPDSPIEVRACVVDAETEGGYPTETVKENEKMEQTLMFSQGEEEEHLAELLKIFSQEVETEMTATLESAIEEEEENMDFFDLYEELEALEKRVMVQSLHIQQAKLEEVGSMPAGEMEAIELPQEETKQ